VERMKEKMLRFLFRIPSAPITTAATSTITTIFEHINHFLNTLAI
jgi:hypothetical protein